MVGKNRAWLGHVREGIEAHERAIRLARAAGDRTTEAQTLGWMALALPSGSMPAKEALERIDTILATSTDRRVQADASLAQSQASAFLGDLDGARTSIGRARSIMLDLGLRTDAAGGRMFLGWLEMVAGDLNKAADELRTCCEELEELGETGYFSTAAGWLSVALARLGDPNEADRYAGLSREAAADDDWLSQIGWRIGRARVLTQRRVLDEAERLAREAVDIGRRTEFLYDTGVALSALADVLHAAGRPEEAITALEEALGLFDRKGDVPDSARIREALAELRG